MKINRVFPLGARKGCSEGEAAVFSLLLLKLTEEIQILPPGCRRIKGEEGDRAYTVYAICSM